jgi:hypothetical protein
MFLLGYARYAPSVTWIVKQKISLMPRQENTSTKGIEEMNEPQKNVEEVFKEELALIRNDQLRNYVIIFFEELCPDYFWTCPCSTTGKYHPKISLGKKGLVRHTKLAVWWGIQLLEAVHYYKEFKDIPKQQLQDEVVAALLMHDMVKNGKGLNARGFPLAGPKVCGTHGYDLAKKITACLDAEDITVKRITERIAGHMGQWTTDKNSRSEAITDDPTLREFVRLIHLADYCAAKKVDTKMKQLEKVK